MTKRFLIVFIIWMSGYIPDTGVLARTFISGVSPTESYVSFSPVKNGFLLHTGDNATALLVSSDDYAGVMRVAGLLQNDICMVTGKKPQIINDGRFGRASGTAVVIIGTVGKSLLMNRLVDSRKLDVSDVEGRWEASLITTVKNPFPGIQEALVIAGSDKRGTIYGMFELSRQMGVSPWYWWADVPVEKHEKLYIKSGRYVLDSPKVKYRGIFINDEAPALSGWVLEHFGGFNHKFYGHVYELILRMRGNLLWPAMWGRSLYDDDPQSAELADEYGIVIGTSHHEPMMRAHVEWERYGHGPWDYNRNAETLREFWREGIKRMADNESLVTVGMRGDGDEPMSADRNIELLLNIIKDQRKIIAEETGKPAGETPQVWALYKEVQEYYDMGMRVDDDITLLYCDDNWGNVRRVPGTEERKREGGSGMYYHFDYVGGPRNYKWLNTNPLPRIWEQMKLSYANGIDRLWIVNVGDIKPMELPTQFFLDLAWDPDAFGIEELDTYTKYWAARQFGVDRADEIASFLSKYAKFNSRRKPELLSPETYSLTNYREAERVVGEYNQLAKEAGSMYDGLPESMKDAYYQLVLFPIEACANLNHLYYVAAKNRLYATQGRALANIMADSVRILFDRDAGLTNYFHSELANGKWNHMMSQTHIGYTYWQQPDQNNIPETKRLDLPDKSLMGIMVEGSGQWWPQTTELPSLPGLNEISKNQAYFEIFNRGKKPFQFEVKPSDSWIKVSETRGDIEDQKRILVSVDWSHVPKDATIGSLSVKANGNTVDVSVPVEPVAPEELQAIYGFVETNGYISIEANDFTDKHESDNEEWIVIPDLGRTGSAVTIQPVTVASKKPSEEQMLEYPVHFTSSGKITVYAYFSPTLNYTGGEGLKYAIAFDGEKPVVANIHENETHNDWQQWVANNINISETEHEITGKGNHVLKFYMVDPGLVLQKIVIDTGGLKNSYLGPEESPFIYQ